MTTNLLVILNGEKVILNGEKVILNGEKVIFRPRKAPNCGDQTTPTAYYSLYNKDICSENLRFATIFLLKNRFALKGKFPCGQFSY